MTTAKERRDTLEALSAFQKSTDFDLAEIAKSVANESDRGLVVIYGSLTEDLLLKRIMENFVPLSKVREKQITRSGGVLSTWADRANVARALGIIDDEDLENIEVMKAMRNACAHSRKHIDFDTRELREVLCLMLNDGSTKVVREADRKEIVRTAFILAASFIWGRIKGESNDRANARVQKIFDEAVAALQQASHQKPTAQPKRGHRPPPKGKGR